MDMTPELEKAVEIAGWPELPCELPFIKCEVRLVDEHDKYQGQYSHWLMLTLEEGDDVWGDQGEVDAGLAHALLEKHLRERLEERGVYVKRWVDGFYTARRMKQDISFRSIGVMDNVATYLQCLALAVVEVDKEGNDADSA
jgi:hypothetical protein